jgi:hypothetical protein
VSYTPRRQPAYVQIPPWSIFVVQNDELNSRSNFDVFFTRQRVRVVKEVDSKSTGLCPREFKSRRRRFVSFLNKSGEQKKSTTVGFEPTRAKPINLAG